MNFRIGTLHVWSGGPEWALVIDQTRDRDPYFRRLRIGRKSKGRPIWKPLSERRGVRPGPRVLHDGKRWEVHYYPARPKIVLPEWVEQFLEGK